MSDNQKGKWVTINGRKVFIPEGKNLNDVMKDDKNGKKPEKGFWDKDENNKKEIKGDKARLGPMKRVTDEDIKKDYEKDQKEIKDLKQVEDEDDFWTDQKAKPLSNKDRMAPGGIKGAFEREGFEVTDVTNKSMKVEGGFYIEDNGKLGFDIYRDGRKVADDIGNDKDIVGIVRDIIAKEEQDKLGDEDDFWADSAKKAQWSKDSVTKDGVTLKLGQDVGGYKITGFDPSTNSVIIEGSDYELDDVLKMNSDKKEDFTKSKIKDQVDDGATDIGYIRQVLGGDTQINQLSDEQIKKIIDAYKKKGK